MHWDFSVVVDGAGALFNAFLVTAALSILSILGGTLIGTLLGIGLLSPRSLLRGACRIAVELFLALPPLVIIIWVYFCLPLLHRAFILGGFASAVVGLSLSLAAFVAEIIRSGFANIPKGQIEVASCLGLTTVQSLWFISLPQAFRRMLLPLLGQYITCYKFSTLATVVAVNELLHTGTLLISNSYRPLEIYTAIAVIFVVTVVPMNYAAKRLEKTSRFGGVDYFL